LKRIMTAAPFQDLVPAPDLVQGGTLLAVVGEYYLLRIKNPVFNQHVQIQLKEDGQYQVKLQLPFAVKGEVGLFKKGDELVVEIGTLRRHIGLPTSMASLTPGRAKLEHRVLTVELKEG